jgi:3-deoxy-D-manno-octulosonic-acid transferase
MCVLLMELEVWPNFLHAASGLRIPVAVINGRISEQSFRGYRMARALLPQFHLIELYCMQDEVYRQRLLDLNVDADRAIVTGNMKYDNVHLEAISADSERLRVWLSPDQRPVIVCGSTHADEEYWLAHHVAEAARSLGQRIRTVIAPRHPERAPGVRDSLAAAGFNCVMWSQLMHTLAPLADGDVIIVDTIGHLETFYATCDVAFIGGSLVPRGGQNMMEAAAMGKAVMFGPHISNFRKDVEQLLAEDAACQVDGRADLSAKLADLLRHPEQRERLGARAVALIQRNQGSTARTLERLYPLFERAAGPRPV